MNLTVFSHKPCWRSHASPTGYATDGGFPFQMHALSELFDRTTVVVPSVGNGPRAGERAITGHNLKIAPLTLPPGAAWRRKIALPFWALRNARTLVGEIHRADAVHAVIPGDVGTVGMLMAWLTRKRLFVRHCGNWLVQRTTAEHFWHAFIERAASRSNVMLVTGGGPEPPSHRNESVHWIFSTALTAQQLGALAPAAARHAWRGPDLITVARQDPEKGTTIIVESLPLLLRQYRNTRLHVVGDGSAIKSCRELAARLGIEDHVVFHGEVGHERVLELLLASDVFCFPTASEGFPKVVLEALACGLPVVTTRVSVLPHLLADGCGIFIDTQDPGSLAAAVHSCLADAARYREMSIRAVRTARQYSLERWRDRIGEFVRAAWGPPRAELILHKP